jgi:serine/threonine-protein kinase
MSLPAPEKLGRYEVVAELGSGAMGVVYRAVDPVLGRTVAIKTIRLTEFPDEAAEYEARFFQEAKAAGGMSHPNVITIFDAGREGDIAYIAMELLEGEELRAWLDRERIPVATAIDIALQVATGLAAVHARGVIHRDVKPANIMILPGMQAKLMDFGIARLPLADVRTKTGLLLGSPKYMSPEQVNARPLDPRSDLFSLGAVLHEMLAGAPPFSGADMNQLMVAISMGAPTPPSRINPAVTPFLDLVVAKALAKDPEARYQSAEEMAADLRDCARDLAGHATRAAAVAASRPVEDATEVMPAAANLATVPGVSVRGSELTRLAVSREFESAAALRRLANEPATGSAAPTILLSLLHDRERLALAGWLLAAIAAALGIALL